MSKVDELIKALKPIIDWSTVNKGDKIFNRCSLSENYIDTFDHIEDWSDNRLRNRLIVFYKNYMGEEWHGDAIGYWYYYK